MNPDPLTRRDGTAYPPSVQAFMLQHFPDLEAEDDHDMRQDLAAAIEAAVAVDREQRPPAPELDDEHASRLVATFVSGMSSGAATVLINLGVQPTAAQEHGAWVGRHVAGDPAMRYELEEDVRHMWATGVPRQPGWSDFTAYPTGPDAH